MPTIYSCLEDRVLIRPIKKSDQQTTAAGILLDTKKEVGEGEVIDVGEGYVARDTGVMVSTILHRGDVVLYALAAGMPLDIPKEEGGFEELRLMREGDCLCLISRKE